uniref:Peptidase M3A/M3B catalytic domain-containing protein n=1 Tax=Coccolithus braarudii TaxID=221442 RepID=A0A7S0Q1G9_9EUKA
MTTFQQNVMADESELTIDLTASELDGCPDFLLSAAKSAAVERGKPAGSYVITLSRSLVEPFLTFSPRRDLREKAWRLWTNRGQLNPARDNLELAKETLLLRCEQARLHGYESFAAYQNADSMAKTPQAVNELLERVWEPACLSAATEAASLEACLRSELSDPSAELEPWDWRYCAEKVRLQRYDFDETALKPYLSLEGMQAALFDTAERLFGLRFVKVDLAAREITLYHPDVELYEVRRAGTTGGEQEDELVALFLHDNYARPNKQSGAWMSEFREQTRNWNTYEFEAASTTGSSVPIRSAGPSCTPQLPIVINNNNFARSEPCLLSFDDALTLFHEMGHGLHGMLSSVGYRRLSGTSVLRDFVELPSQLLEHWLSSTDAVLARHAAHWATGEPVPPPMLRALHAARNFNQGFETVEYTVCALLDQALHALPEPELGSLRVDEFEAETLRRLKMPKAIVMRHRPAHFLHLFADSGYAAAYYVYLWAEVLDADAFDSFLESGDVFDAPTASRLAKWIYSTGNSVEPSEAYRRFKGRDPTVEPMLKKKGLLPAAA